MNCGAGHRQGSNLALLWLWDRPAAIGPLAWELPYTTGIALKSKKKKKKKACSTQVVVDFLIGRGILTVRRDL